MYNRNTDHARNKRDAEAIVYQDAGGNTIRLTRGDFASEEEFLLWKAWSDVDRTPILWHGCPFCFL